MTTDNLIQTFQLEGPNLRGRILRLGTTLNDLLARHAYPEPVTRLTGEAAVLTLLLSSMMKYDGIFTLQTQSVGPVSMLVSDVVGQGQGQGTFRACARFRVGDIPGDVPGGGADAAALLGSGHLAFTVDQGPDTERYQGIVELSGPALLDSVRHYFSQSEQITTGFRMALGRGADGAWRAGAIMLQELPGESGRETAGEGDEDNWRRAMVLLQSCTDGELLDPDLSQNDLLYRLFHEEGVRVFDPVALGEGCRCSRERAENIIGMMSPEERTEMTVDGKILVTCEFCDRQYDFPAT